MHLPGHSMERYRIMLGFLSYLSMDFQGRNGDLALLWNTELKVMIKNYSSNHIHATVEEEDLSHHSWDFIGTYGVPKS